jgi:hypothetical protein
MACAYYYDDEVCGAVPRLSDQDLVTAALRV